MSFHNKPEWNTPDLHEAMRAHNLPIDTPSQLADAFRSGWFAAKASETPSSS